MREIGMTKKTDAVGRLVLPKELRTAKDIQPGDMLEMFVEGSRIVLARENPACALCGSRENLAQCAAGYLCITCIEEIQKMDKRDVKNGPSGVEGP